MTTAQTLRLIEGEFAVVRLNPKAETPDWARAGSFFGVQRTSAEQSILCSYQDAPADVTKEGPFRAFEVAGPLSFELVGIMASLTAPLSSARVSVFCVSTFDTDYLLVHRHQVPQAAAALVAAGHDVVGAIPKQHIAPGLPISSRRLSITELEPTDAAALFAYRSDASVRRFQSWAPESVADAERFITRNTAERFGRLGSWYQLAVRDDETLVGDLGVHFASSHQAEVGITIHPTHQRKGLGSEALQTLMKYLFHVAGVHRVSASVDPRNQSSLALMKSVGMRQEGLLRKSLLWKGEWVDDAIFARLKTD